MFQYNRFGEGDVFSFHEIQQKNPELKFFCESTACLSVTSDMWSYASAHTEIKWVHTPAEAEAIIVLGCQVTDLAILNDIRRAEHYHELFPGTPIYMGGCLAQRFDIQLPEYVRRLDIARVPHQPISDSAIQNVAWQKPFWVSEDTWRQTSSDEPLGPGRLFRNMYPLKIGAGCHRKCEYCTIRDTRGASYEIEPQQQVHEFLEAVNRGRQVVLVSDSPSPDQIRDWADIALYWGKPLSIRNVEPQVLVRCQVPLLDMAEEGLLPIFHCPIQSNNKDVLKSMGRDPTATAEAIKLMQRMRAFGTKVATNVIIDYQTHLGFYHNMDTEWLNANFDYWVWNPYFDGAWSRERAEKRFRLYLETAMMPGELRVEEVMEILSSMPIKDGGIPRWMITDSFMPSLELIQDRCAAIGVKVVFIQENKTGGSQ